MSTASIANTQATPAPAQKTSNRKVVVAAVIGNLLEFYDFTVYSFLALTIGKLFFPATNDVNSLLAAFGVFAVSYVMRPLGGFVIGRYADVAGRKYALSLTIGLMALGTGMIGLAPTYETIGMAAPIIIIVARLLQGFAQGGEFGAATATLLETGPAKTRSFRASWQLASQGAAALLGASVTTILTNSLTTEAMMSWGWRVPFLLGILIAPVGIYLRQHINEESPQKHAVSTKDDPKRGLYIRNWFLTVFAIWGMSVTTYMLQYYMTPFCIKYLGMPPQLATFSSMAASIIALTMSPVWGLWSDKLGLRKPLLIIGRAALIVLIYPAFWLMIQYPSMPLIMGLMVVLMLFYTMGSAPAYALMPENFPKHIRASYLSSAYAVSVSLFGGTTPFVATWLIEFTGSKMAPACYMIISVAISLVAISMFEETGGKKLDEEAAAES